LIQSQTQIERKNGGNDSQLRKNKKISKQKK